MIAVGSVIFQADLRLLALGYEENMFGPSSIVVSFAYQWAPICEQEPLGPDLCLQCCPVSLLRTRKDHVRSTGSLSLCVAVRQIYKMSMSLHLKWL